MRARSWSPRTSATASGACQRQPERLDRARNRRRRLLLRRGRRLLVVLVELTDLDVEQVLLALAPHLDLDGAVDRRLRDDPRQVPHVRHVLAVEGEDDIARLDAGDLRRATVAHAGDERALGLVEAQALGDLVGDALDVDAEPAAPR